MLLTKRKFRGRAITITTWKTWRGALVQPPESNCEYKEASSYPYQNPHENIIGTYPLLFFWTNPPHPHCKPNSTLTSIIYLSFMVLVSDSPITVFNDTMIEKQQLSFTDHRVLFFPSLFNVSGRQFYFVFQENKDSETGKA